MKHAENNARHQLRFTGRFPVAGILLLSVALALPGCFDPVYPQIDRERRVLEALDLRDGRLVPPSPLTPSDAVIYALRNNLDAKVAEIELAYQSESAVASRRRLLPSLTGRYSMEHNNHPSARWSESTRSGSQSLESSYSSDTNSRQSEAGMMFNLIDFGVGFIKTRQQNERIRSSAEQRRRVRQQIVLEVLSHYWRAAAALAIANEAESLRKELEEQAASVRDSVEMRILSGAEGARRELAVHGGLAELEQWRRAAAQAKLELGRVMGCGNSLDFEIAALPGDAPELPPFPDNDPSNLQAAALQRRPELYQQDAQERIAVDEARVALLQMAPNANLSMNLYHDPDKFLEWSDWMTVGARVSWNLFNIPARFAERRMAKLQEESAREKGLALAVAIMAQVGIAHSEWRLSQEYASILNTRAAARSRLVEALAAGEQDGQTRPGEVLQERVRLLAEKAASLRAVAEARVAGARLANAIGLDVDESGRLMWKLGREEAVDLLHNPAKGLDQARIQRAEKKAAEEFPDQLSGLKVVKAEDFVAPAKYFQAESVVTEKELEAIPGDAVAIAAAVSEPEPESVAESVAESVPESVPAVSASGEKDDAVAAVPPLSEDLFRESDSNNEEEETQDWMRLMPGSDMVDMALAPDDFEDSRLPSAEPVAAEEVSAMAVPKGFGPLSRVRNLQLPRSSFVGNGENARESGGPAEIMRDAASNPAERQTEARVSTQMDMALMQALAPLEMLSSPVAPPPAPSVKEKVALRPPEAPSASGSLRP